MKVNLVGTNVELEPLASLVADKTLLSPEPIAAAYARISRSPEAVQQLRAAARRDVESARRSNQRIVFDMGHSSIAEHAVFNFDVEGLSRLAIEELERSRLASFTERSQRYVLMETAYHVPAEARRAGHEELFRARYEALFCAYNGLHSRLLKQQLEAIPGPVTRAQKQDLETVAREDARYVLPLAALGQLGMTVNARTLEATVRRLSAHPLEEVRELADALEREALTVAPSLIRHTGPTGLFDPGGFWLPVGRDESAGVPTKRTNAQVRLVGHTQAVDDVLAGTLAWLVGGGASTVVLREWVDSYYRDAMPHHSAPRLFEFAEFTFEAVVSAACFGQLKRHRMASLLAGPYVSALGVRVPPSIEFAGLSEALVEAAGLPVDLVARGGEFEPALAYALTNGHCRKVLLKMNLRELYHFCRLRMDAHAQWEIRELAVAMAQLVVGVAPVSATYLCGKDEFGARKRR